MNTPPPTGFNIAVPRMLDFLLSRRSAKIGALTGPGPAPDELRKILTAAARVPDHGKLFPWRFILFEGEARERMGQILVEALSETEPLSEQRRATESGRFLRAPVVVGVVSKVRPGIPIPEWEQILSAGAVCMNLLLGAQALGFTGAWLTEWYAYHPKVQTRLGLEPGERIAGFIYLGKSSGVLEERPRPDLDKIVTRF